MTTTQIFPDEANVLEACGRLVDFGAWEQTKIDPEGWLANFPQAERGYALILLSRFTFLADHLVDQLFRSAFQNLSNLLTDDLESFEDASARWRDFCRNALITIVQGEDPNPSDSGWLFARKARQAVGINQGQLFEPREVIERLANGFTGPVVFVDDFVGSGEQFLKTWRRPYSHASGSASFESLAVASRAATPRATFYYCNAMTTEYGRGRVNRHVPQLRISAGNVIPERHSLANPDSLLWPEPIRADGIAFVERVCRRLGYDQDDGSEADWRGFHKLGLALAFQHSVPDANLPLFFSDNSGWTPLVRRL
ncbi:MULTISPECIES: hypothetical protein [unclassified Sphingopyxis]|uniref:phosphoribosyltransferase-like protein n=1 Tax=unclassified Sphingopyxis TaxID=2614943 RepID=UPI0007312025|nr:MULTISPECIES: hypothetical protein [unclassified Sphingopyxis]KTE24104.1 hypothetical protein ATE61_14405 [Sphingopyxis sp. H057]KTE50402.1 hypothetical protein ATE64_16325 [Sphingopyxis sp. H073]KTE52491.1 hypothetical protein ATE69_13705 [Sphingopyxis sp. H071]KTE62984.1 hypothetical protein ATE66_01225 [Sphingopyxis sp. H107]KTE64872.1 hypothetical protein ATE65_10460 [Sphingopyxis sp. H100]